MYQGAIEALGNETENKVIGKRIVLPSSFIGGPRHLKQLYQDAMSLVAEYGNPSLFITITANPQWPEITTELEPGQIYEDRPDLVVRVFALKLHELLDDLIKRNRLEVCVAYVYLIEFQKRGLPHCHLILFLCPDSRLVSTSDINCLVSAQFPDPVTESTLFELVTQHMLHGPCQKYPCWNGTECTNCRHGDVELPMKYFAQSVDEPVPAFFRSLLQGIDVCEYQFGRHLVYLVLIFGYSRCCKVLPENSKIQQCSIIYIPWHVT